MKQYFEGNGEKRNSLTTKLWIDSIGIFVSLRFVLTRGSYLINKTGNLGMTSS
jgi:hypothetical protein